MENKRPSVFLQAIPKEAENNKTVIVLLTHIIAPLKNTDNAKKGLPNFAAFMIPTWPK